jgi:hypothetical protein
VIAESIRAAIEAPDTPKATASVGAAVGPITNLAEFEAIHACADETMYAAKRNGGNRIALSVVVSDAESSQLPDEIPFRPLELGDNSGLGAESLG